MSETGEQCAAWDAARAGDANLPDYDGMPCGLYEPYVPAGHRAMGCTRQHGHSGQHVATSLSRVLAVWSQIGSQSTTSTWNAYAHAAELARLASLKFTPTGDRGPEWVRREVVLDLAERLAELARETT